MPKNVKSNTVEREREREQRRGEGVVCQIETVRQIEKREREIYAKLKKNFGSACAFPSLSLFKENQTRTS